MFCGYKEKIFKSNGKFYKKKNVKSNSEHTCQPVNFESNCKLSKMQKEFIIQISNNKAPSSKNLATFKETWEKLNEVQNMRALCFGDNAMVTQYFTSTSKGTIYFFASLDPLASNVMINEDAFNLVDASQIHIARKQRTVSATSYEPLGDWLYSNWSNPWNYNLLHGEDRFAGIQFYDENDCLHYGWIRCAVVDSNEQLVIKDYAFETFCGWGIETADTSGGHVAINENNLPGVTIYCNQSNIIIDLTQLNENTSLNIYDITGKLIYVGNLESLHTQIPFNHKGNYLVVINQQGKKLVKKIVMI